MPASVVQSAKVSWNSGTTDNLSMTVTAGNVVCGIVVCETTGTGPDVTDVSDADGAYTFSTQFKSGRATARGFYKVAPSSGSKTITFTASVSCSYFMIVWEIHDADGAAPIPTNWFVGNYQNAGSYSAAADALTSTPLTPDRDGSAILGATTQREGVGVSPGTGFTLSKADATMPSSSEQLIQTTAASIAATFTPTGTTGNFVTAMIIVQPTGGGVPPLVPFVGLGASPISS